MNDKIDLKGFDLMGIIEIPKDELDIDLRPLVTETDHDTYLSRSKLFWKKQNCIDAIGLRKNLLQCLDAQKFSGKNAFLVLDYISNISGKIYYKLCEDYINQKCDIKDVLKAKHCLSHDIKNMVSLLENNTYSINFYDMPTVDGLMPERNIECNNMALLYIFAKSLVPPKSFNILNTGLGGVFIGPFFNAIYGADWSNLLKSKYVTTGVDKKNSILDLIVEKSVFDNHNVLFLDDNVGTGATMFETKKDLETLGYEVKCGAIQYNWLNFYKVAIGEKNIERFDPTKIDYVTQFNYPGHKLLEHIIDIFNGTRNGKSEIVDKISSELEISKNYFEYKESKHYFGEDVKTLQHKSYKYSSMTDFNIFNDEIDSRYNSLLSKDSVKLMNNINDLTDDLFNNKKVDHLS